MSNKETNFFHKFSAVILLIVHYINNSLKYFWNRSISLHPESATPLAILRIGISSILILQAISLKDYLYPLVGRFGIMQSEITNALTPTYLPRIEWATQLFSKLFGFSEIQTIYICFILYIFFLALLAIGCFTRVTALFAWILHLAFNTSGVTSTYGVYEFTNIALFYCFVMPVGDVFSIDSWIYTIKTNNIYYAISRRVIQWHLCIVYITSGIEKAKGIQWWNGEAVWRVLMREDVPLDFSWLAYLPVVAVVSCWLTLVVEIGYGIFIWFQYTRKIWLLMVIFMHIGIGVFLGLWFFSATMIILNVVAFYSFRAVQVENKVG